MKQIFTQIILIYSLLSGFGCSSKQAFYLNRENNFAAYKKERRELATGSKTVIAQLETERAVYGISSAASLIAASNQPDNAGTYVSFQKRMVPGNNESAKSLKSLQNEVYPTQKRANTKPKIEKNYSSYADNNKPTHKLASLGFTLGSAGLVLALIGLLTVTTFPLLLAFLMSIPGFIISRKGLAKIKQQPEQYGGKGLAVGGLVMSGLMLILFAALIFLLLAFAGAFA